MYDSAKQTRLTADWYAPNNSADSELISSLTQMRARSRALVRDAPYAKRAKLIVVNNIVGSGIYMEPQVKKPRGALLENVNEDIEAAWDDWSVADNCHTGGKLNFCDFERQLMGQIFEAGEILIRKWYQPFGNSKIPFALELIEPERLADEWTQPFGFSGVQGLLRMGVERDTFGRPLGFWLREYHPGEIRIANANPDRLFRVPADQMFHLYPCDRWPQTRGEPWLHAVAKRLNDMHGYSEAEIIAARGAAAYMGFIESPEDPQWADDNVPVDQQPQIELEPGIVQTLNPGQEFNFASPNRPNPNMDPFMRMMLREVAAGCGPSYESLSRDYSQSNYSSSRLALLDDRDMWKVMQKWFIRSFRLPLHREWLRQAVLSRAIASIDISSYVANPKTYEAVSFKPRGWSWIDPEKEVDAYTKAVRAGFMNVSQVIAITGEGADPEDIWSERKDEIESIKAKGLKFTTDPNTILERGETDAGVLPSKMLAPNEPASATVLPMKGKQ